MSESVEQALEAAIEKFHAYAVSHASKGTPKGNEKAMINRSMARRMENALRLYSSERT
jgi:hypothetical protein